MRLALTALLLAGIAATPALAGQSPASAAAKGRIAPLGVQVTASLPAAATKAMTAKASRIIDMVLATPTFTNPRGFSLTRSLRIHAVPNGSPAWFPAYGEVTMIAQDIDLESGAKPDASGAYMGRLEGPGFHIGINDLSALYSNTSWSESFAGGVHYLALRRGSSRGFPVFRVGMRDVILITKPGRLPYVHVTQGDYLRDQIAETRAGIARVGGTPHPKAQAALDREVAALAALSPQQRAAPACHSSRLSLPLGDCSEANATYYVRMNPNYFDKGLSKGAVQLVTIESPAEGGHGHPRLEPKLRAVARELDPAAIQALLD